MATEPATPPTMIERVREYLKIQEAEIAAILDDDLVTSGIKQSCRRLATTMGAIGATVDLPAVACAAHGPQPRSPDLRTSADASPPTWDNSVRNTLWAIRRQAQILNDYPDESADEKRSRRTGIIKHAEAGLKLLKAESGPAEPQQGPDEEEKQAVPPSLDQDLDDIEECATLIRARSDDNRLNGGDCASWTSHIIHRVGMIRKAFGITE